MRVEFSWKNPMGITRVPYTPDMNFPRRTHRTAEDFPVRGYTEAVSPFGCDASYYNSAETSSDSEKAGQIGSFDRVAGRPTSGRGGTPADFSKWRILTGTRLASS